MPSSYIQAWRMKALWPNARQIEQDLIISRALGFSVIKHSWNGLLTMATVRR